MKEILLAHGSGGVESHRLIEEVFYQELGNEILARNEDAGVVEDLGKMAVSTDGYTVTPPFFPGGNIGKLAVCGSANDVAMMGAQPRYMTASFMIEEGFSVDSLRVIVASMGEELKKGGIKLISGDTKVIPRGGVDGIFITTTAFGEVKYPLSMHHLSAGDAVLVSGAVGTHGAVIYASREDMGLQSELVSDCASLWGLLEPLLVANLGVKAMRDATRGGLAAVLNEWAQATGLGIEIEESTLPFKQEVRGICEILGFEPCNLANEGMCVIALPKENAARALEILRSHPLGKEASLIGVVGEAHGGRVVMHSEWGTRRFLDYPSGELLPRIC